MRYMESLYFFSGRKVDLRASESEGGAEFGAMPRRLSNRPFLFPSLIPPFTFLSFEFPDGYFQHAPHLSLVRPRAPRARDRSRGRLLPTPDLVGQREQQRVRSSLSLPSPPRFSFGFFPDLSVRGLLSGCFGVLVWETTSIIPLENVKTVSYARIDPIVSPGEPHRHGGWTSPPPHHLTILRSFLTGVLGLGGVDSSQHCRRDGDQPEPQLLSSKGKQLHDRSVRSSPTPPFSLPLSPVDTLGY